MDNFIQILYRSIDTLKIEFNIAHFSDRVCLHFFVGGGGIINC